MTLEFFEVRHLPHRVLQLFFEPGHVVAGQDEIFASALHVGPDFLGGSGRVFEIASDCFLNLLAAVE